MKLPAIALLAIIHASFAATPAKADEIIGGLYVHDVDTFLTIAGVEDGMDVQLGWRGDRRSRDRSRLRRKVCSAACGIS